MQYSICSQHWLSVWNLTWEYVEIPMDSKDFHDFQPAGEGK